MQLEVDIPDDVIADIRRHLETFTPSQRRIAECIVERPDAVAFATVHKLAERLGVSPSTIVRFAYRMRPRRLQGSAEQGPRRGALAAALQRGGEQRARIHDAPRGNRLRDLT